jgi:hypothetical protein
LGNLISRFVNILVRKEGLNNLEFLNQALSEGKSILIYGNHPNSLATGYIHPIFRLLSNRNIGATGALVSYKFIDGRMGIPGKIVMSVFATDDLTPLPVVQFYDTMAEEKRKKINREATESAICFLKADSGIVLIFPEATRSQSGMIKVQSGLGRFALHADYVLPVVSPYPIWRRVPFLARDPVRILPPIEMLKLAPLITMMGNKPFSELFSEYLMALLAYNVPEANRGYYADAARWFDCPATGRFFSIHDNLTRT